VLLNRIGMKLRTLKTPGFNIPLIAHPDTLGYNTVCDTSNNDQGRLKQRYANLRVRL